MSASAVTGNDPHVMEQVAYAIARKQNDMARQQGDAAIQMIQDAAQTMQQTPSLDPSVGANLDVVA